MNKEEQDIIVFLEISATTKAKKTIISKEDVKCLLNYIDKLQKENKQLKEKLHEKNMQIIKLNELLAEVVDMPNEENSNQPKI